MKALTLYQPWATLVAHGLKQWETRSYQPPWRNNEPTLLAIHSGMRWDIELQMIRDNPPFCDALVCEHCKGEGILITGKKQTTCADCEGIGDKPVPFGCVLAVATVRSVMDTTAWMREFCTRGADDREYCFGDYSPGRYAWHLTDVRRLPHPIPCRGFQRVWNLSDEVEANVKRQLNIP